MKTRVTEMLGIAYPIVQGGLARVAKAELCAAVSEAGGLGQIATAGLEGAAALRAEIQRCRTLTQKPFGVNFPLGRMDITAMMEVALEEGVPVIALTAGNPAPWIKRINGAAKILVLIAGPELAKKAEAAGADMVATVGYEGGGHLGRSDETTFVMVPRVVRAVSIPVLASGGIATGAGLLAALSLGAEGVEMGTRFVATREAQAHENYKQAIVSAEPSGTMIIKRSLGMPGRALVSAFAQQIAAREAAGAPAEEIVPMIAGSVNAIATDEGRMQEGFAWAGQCSGLIEDIPPAGEVVRRMVQEAEAGLLRLRGAFAA
ncbi:nitronate monooxygenase [Sediminicoccus sp. KRV36]|uniref:NAD(P)H-dependent flavin oxidoreductase n=1 Tax=Sediminicoccus sp. KRV36 TaxID=3133721 RepID=UPI00200D2671|nr:nitronate monooxygenase [Sediminicoccus rosea]UPY38251.1 nitronate monooxygenase [Sediminicoccus rosea]